MKTEQNIMVTAGSHLPRAALFTATTDEASPGIKSYFFSTECR